MTTIRTLKLADHSQFMALYLSAPAADRATRFCGVISDAQVCRYVDSAISKASGLIGAFDGDTLVGTAEVFLHEGDAELAFLVAPVAKGKGLGLRLVSAATACARSSGAKKVSVMAAKDNYAMHKTAIRSGLVRDRYSEEWRAELALRAC